MTWVSKFSASLLGMVRSAAEPFRGWRTEYESDRLDLDSALEQVELYLRRGQFQDVIRTVDRLEHDTENTEEIHTHWFGLRGFALDALGDAGAAIDSYEQALERDPANRIALINLATILACGTDEQYLDGARAVDLSRRALKSGGEQDWQSWQCLASALARTGEFPAAEVALARGRALVPPDLEWRVERLAGFVGRGEAFTLSREELATRHSDLAPPAAPRPGTAWLAFLAMALLAFVIDCLSALPPGGSWIPPLLSGILLAIVFGGWRVSRHRDSKV